MKCLCGCGQDANRSNGYVQGHWLRGRPTHSGTQKSDRLSEEHKAKIKLGVRGAFAADPTITQRSTQNRTGLCRSPEAIQKTAEKNRNGQTHSTAMRAWWRSRTPKQKQESLRRTFKQRGQSIGERELDAWFAKHFPGQWKYVGDGEFWISGRNPDFVNINGAKAVVEVYGTYYHSGAFPHNQSEEERRQYYGKWGFACFVIWSNRDGSFQNLRELHAWCEEASGKEAR